ncbi:hypothetical protein ACIA2T_30755 [Amycolatopsis japonica]|uniref:hypothetical protein n=1 Tax=Amycolatopsis japonica TaxID=208439 RepID=UPI0037901466
MITAPAGRESPAGAAPATIIEETTRVAWKVTGYHVGETVLWGLVVGFIGSLTTGFVVLITGGAPHEMIALAAAELVCLVAALAITFGLEFKISMHAMVAAGAAVMLIRVYGPWLALVFLGVGWVCWSRVELGGGVYLLLDAVLA